MTADSLQRYRKSLQQLSHATNQTTLALADLRAMSIAHVYGIVSTIKKYPAKSGGTDFSMSFCIVDPTLNSSSFVPVNMFCKELKDFPPVKQGDIVRCRMKVGKFNEKFQGVISSKITAGSGLTIMRPSPDYQNQYRNNPSSSAFSSPGSIASLDLEGDLFNSQALASNRGTPSPRQADDAGVNWEQKVVDSLKAWWDDLMGGPVPDAPPSSSFAQPLPDAQGGMSSSATPVRAHGKQTFAAPTPSKRPELSIADLTHPNVFFDLFAKVVHIPHDINTRDDSYVLGLSDFTVNPNLRAYQNAGSLPAYLPSNSVITVTFWEENARAAREAQIGDILAMRNLRCKSGLMNDGGFEASLHGERHGRSRSKKVSVVPETEYRDWDRTPERVHPKILALLRREMALRQGDLPPVLVVDPVSDMSTGETSTMAVELPITRIVDILSCVSEKDAIQPAKYRVSVRVVDFLPKSIYDFTRLCCNECLESLESSDAETSQECIKCGTTGMGDYQWVFSFLVTDGTGYIPVILSYDDATFFLNGLEPCCLTSPISSPSRQRLLDSINHLWGTTTGSGVVDAESGHFSPKVFSASKEFECLIASYVIEDELGESAVRYKIFNSKMSI